MLRLKELRKQKGYSQSKIATILGISQPAYANYERGAREADYETLSKLAEIFDVSIDYLLGFSQIKESSTQSRHPLSAKIPVIGKVQAGIPIDAIEEILDYEEIAPEMAANGQYFGLMVRGDSMFPAIVEGDIVIVRCQADVNSGDIAVVLVNDNDATVKKIKKSAQGITLIPLNPAYDYINYTNYDIEKLPVQILGKVVELRRKF